MHDVTPLVSLAFASLLAALPQELASRPANLTAPRFATARGGKLRGLPHAGAPAVRDLTPGEALVAVGRQDQFYEVIVPGGYPAWVWGAYTREGKSAGTVDIVEDGINLRPEPRSDAKAVPIARLNKGASLVMIGRQNDWVQVAAPEEIHGYVLVNDLDLTNDAPEARARELTLAAGWVESLRVEAAKREAARKADLERQVKEDEARKEVSRKQLAARQRCSDGFTWLRGYPDAAARSQAAAAFDEAEKLARELAPKDAEGILAEVQRGRERLDTIAFHERERREELERLQREAAEVERRTEAAIASAQAAIDRHGKPRPVDAFGARFAGNGLGIGWLRREIEVPRGRVYKLEKGGRLLFYVTCSSGKYDLDDFLNREVGLIGEPKVVDGFPVRVVDVDRIEVLSTVPG